MISILAQLMLGDKKSLAEVGGADGQGVGASVGKEVEVCPGDVRGRDLVNLV